MDKKSAIPGASVRLLQAFAEAARHGSFAMAARELGLSPSAIAKSVLRLEQQLRLRLFQRTTRRVTLTQEGEAFYARCRRVLDELSELSSVAAEAVRAPAGTLRIDAPVTYGKNVIVPVVARLAARHPALRLDLRLSDQYADVIASGVDAVVRVGEIADARLVARRIGEQQLVVLGAPAYFKRRGKPRRPQEVEGHDCVLFRMPTSGRHRPWEFLVKRKSLVLHPPPRHELNEGEGMVSAACAGLGLVQIPHFMADAAVKSGALEEVLAAYRPKPTPISVVFPTHRHMPPRLRVFIDALAGG
ncbi:MAG TPA: LysR substrate-binding domain-containing protein [Burkholderiales bacterium]|nr:LysR substrate-binding domain-containing protein [Burkholderiales bacterium]